MTAVAHPPARPSHLAQWRLGMLVAVVLLTSGLGLAPGAGAATRGRTVPRSPTATTSAGPLVWTAPGEVDRQPIDGIACPTSSLCVAVDRAGGALWSTDPAVLTVHGCIGRRQ